MIEREMGKMAGVRLIYLKIDQHPLEAAGFRADYKKALRTHARRNSGRSVEASPNGSLAQQQS